MISFDEFEAGLNLTAENEAEIARHRARMDAEQRGYKLLERREERALTRAVMAKNLGVSPQQVSNIEHGDIAHTEIGTLQAYVAALDGRLDVIASFAYHQIKLI